MRPDVTAIQVSEKRICEHLSDKMHDKNVAYNIFLFNPLGLP